MIGLSKEDQADSHQDRSVGDDLSEPLESREAGEDHCSEDGTDSYSSHENPKGLRPSLEDLGDNRRHENCVGHPDQADDGNTDQDATDERIVKSVGATSLQVVPDIAFRLAWLFGSDFHLIENPDDSNITQSVG